MGDWAVDTYVRSAPAHTQERGRLTRWVLPAVIAVGALALIASAESATAAPILSAAPTASTVSAGETHTCGVQSDGLLACWGDNGSGQSSPPAGTFSQVSSGTFHTCAIRTDRTLACWGSNGFGQTSAPSGTFSDVSSGAFHTCAVKSDGTLACWGDDGSGQATPPAGTFSQVSAGGFHTCAVRSNGTVACWGSNFASQASPPAGTFSQVAAGSLHTCGVQSDGSVACWGANSIGESTPPAGSFSQVSSGDLHTCGIRTDETIACWGYNFFGQSTPPAGTFTQVSAGGSHTCAVKTDGTLACWGENTLGQASPPAGAFIPPADSTAPVITAPAPITAEATGPSGALVTYTVTATDPDDAATVSCTPASGSMFSPGPTVVRCTAADTHGNTSNASFVVTVTDTAAPSVTIDVTSPVEATGASGAVVTYTASATDTVSGSLTPICTPFTGSTFPLGTTTITCTAADDAGNQGTAAVTVLVRDTIAPGVTINVGGPVEASGPSGAAVVYTATATDTVSGSLTPSCAPASGSTFPLGRTAITCSATDGAGNTGSATATATVQDTTLPVVNISAPSTVEASGPTGAPIAYTATASDTVSGSLTPTCAPASGSTFLGSTAITCTATDGVGNGATASATVLVRDTTPPVVNISVASPVEATGPSGAPVSYTASATDAVSGSPAPSCTPASGTTFPLGGTTITCSATDGAGNTGTAAATVVVEDKTAPTLSLPANITTPATSAAGAAVTFAVSATDPDNLAADLTVSCSPPSGSTFATGTTTVTCNATDPAGNAGTGSFQVTVVDFSLGSISPVTVAVGGTASASVVVNSVGGFSSAVALSASGAPAGASLTLNPTSVTPPPGGGATSTLTLHVSPGVTPTTFTLTITGAFGGVSHSSTASVTVTVSSPTISDVIAQMLAAGCIDNAGVANALTAKLTAEQGAIGAGSTKTAINILSAFIDQVRAQSGNHIAPTCTVGGVTFNPATALVTDARRLIDGLAVSATPNPITGTVRTVAGSGIAGAIVTLQDSSGTTLATATTDVTGFYFFATTGLLTPGATYTVSVSLPIAFTGASPASQTFTWSGSGEVALTGFEVT
jgi:hypothetical protein